MTVIKGKSIVMYEELKKLGLTDDIELKLYNLLKKSKNKDGEPIMVVSGFCVSVATKGKVVEIRKIGKKTGFLVDGKVVNNIQSALRSY